MSAEYEKVRKDAQKEYDKISLKHQLAGILESMKKQDGEVFDEKAENVTLHIDTVNGLVGVYSDDRDVKGRPVQQWELNKNTGHIIKTKRARDGSEVHVTEKEVDPESLVPSYGKAHIKKEENTWFMTPT